MADRPIPTGYKKGLWAELRAAAYLRLRGYKLRARRYKTPLGEIDLVVERGQTLVFVEVKLRTTLEGAADAIHIRNQKRVRAAAELYLQQYPQYNNHDMRFDALILTPGRDIAHLEAAWM